MPDIMESDVGDDVEDAAEVTVLGDVGKFPSC